MRTETPQTIRRADYQPLAWTVTDVDLHFALDPAATIVTSRLTLKRNPKAPADRWCCSATNWNWCR